VTGLVAAHLAARNSAVSVPLAIRTSRASTAAAAVAVVAVVEADGVFSGLTALLLLS
jgi:hypothetical protein